MYVLDVFELVYIYVCVYEYMYSYYSIYIIIHCTIHIHTLLLDFKVTFAVFDLQEGLYNKDFIFPVPGEAGIPYYFIFSHRIAFINLRSDVLCF